MHADDLMTCLLRIASEIRERRQWNEVDLVERAPDR
jgi:hypothetical protein